MGATVARVIAGLLSVVLVSTGAAASGSDGFTAAAASGSTPSGATLAFGAAEVAPQPTFEQVLDPVDLAADPASDGYWRTDGAGRVEASGGAAHVGSARSIPLASPVVAIAPTPSGLGYWLAAADGGVFAFGDAAFFGSMGGTPLNSPIVAIGATPSGLGYWLAAADGGVFAFGDAAFLGSMGGVPLISPVMGFAPTSGGTGYWLAAQDGGVFSFGAAPFHGSIGGLADELLTSFAAGDDGSGYWLSGPVPNGPVGLFDTLRSTTALETRTSGTTIVAAGTTLQSSGDVSFLGGEPWLEVSDTTGETRLVRYDDLTPTVGIDPGAEALPCDGGPEPASFPTPFESPTVAPTDVADIVYGVHHVVEADGCERVVIVFGTRSGDGAEPASTVPGGVNYRSVGTRAEVYLPFTASLFDLITLETGRVGERSELFTIFRQLNPPGSRELGLHVHADTARRMEATFLSDPGRVVVDLGPTSSAPGAEQVSRFGSTTPEDPTQRGEPLSILTQLVVDGDDVEVFGFARPFEATLEVRVREASDMPGAGASVTATYTGGILGTVTTDGYYGVMTNDYIDAWGAYTFGIEGLAPGEYELYAGQSGFPEGAGEQGARADFTIEP